MSSEKQTEPDSGPNTSLYRLWLAAEVVSYRARLMQALDGPFCEHGWPIICVKECELCEVLATLESLWPGIGKVLGAAAEGESLEAADRQIAEDITFAEIQSWL